MKQLDTKLQLQQRVAKKYREARKTTKLPAWENLVGILHRRTTVTGYP